MKSKMCILGTGAYRFAASYSSSSVKARSLIMINVNGIWCDILNLKLLVLQYSQGVYTYSQGITWFTFGQPNITPGTMSQPYDEHVGKYTTHFIERTIKCYFVWEIWMNNHNTIISIANYMNMKLHYNSLSLCCSTFMMPLLSYTILRISFELCCLLMAVAFKWNIEFLSIRMPLARLMAPKMVCRSVECW